MSFIEHAMDGYSRTETELNKKALSIGEGSHKRTLSSLFVETIHQASKMRDEFENKSKHWIDQGAQFVNDYIDRSTYKGQNQRVVQRFIKGTILDNKVTHMLIKTVDKGFQLKSHFEAGVAKGVVDSVAGLAKLGTTVSALQQKINPLTMSLEAAAYVADTASSADPLKENEGYNRLRRTFRGDRKKLKPNPWESFMKLSQIQHMNLDKQMLIAKRTC